MTFIFQKNISRTDFIVFWSLILVQALAWAKFLVSVGMWGVILVGSFTLVGTTKATQMTGFQWLIHYLQVWKWRFSPPQYLARFWQKKSYFWIAIPFFITVLTLLESSNWTDWLHDARLQLPFFVLPLAFANMPDLSERQILNILYFFFLSMTTQCLLVLGNYALNYETITAALGRGQSMPFMREHISFCMMTAFAVFVGWFLWERKFVFRYRFESNLVISMTIFLFIALHILSVRSALFALYLALFYKTFQLIFQKGKLLIGILSLAFILSLPILSYRFIPSFQQKISYMQWDFAQHQQGIGENYSDSERLTSIQVGWKILKQQPFFGLGAGDFRTVLAEEYRILNPNLEPKLPHNQFIINGLRAGLVGILLCLFSFWSPLILSRTYRREWLFIAFHLVVFPYFFFEMPFEGAFSIGFFSFFVCLFLKFKHENTEGVLP